jgi:hypothetical protein
MTFQATHRLGLATLAAFIAAAGSACGGGADSAVPADAAADTAMSVGPVDQVATVYSPDLGIDLASMALLPGGVYVRDLEPGAADTVADGDRVSVDYTGWLPNGAQFDASDGSPIVFTIGAGDVIPGWDHGIAGMQVGGRRVLVIPPALAYGERGLAGVIPPNATLVFDVRLVEILPDTTLPADTASAHD